MARSRTQAWLRDELILALDLYMREGRNPPRASLERLSGVLRAIPIEPELAENGNFRNPSAVGLKIYNFVALDPSTDNVGMTRGGQGDARVWDTFSGDPTRLRLTAAAIEANLTTIAPSQAEPEDDSIAEAPEGRLLTRVHAVRERNPKLVATKKAQRLEETGKLACEVCGFEFADTYGERGTGFIECHHTVPVSSLRKGATTKLVDLALLCSNCHRMIHRSAPWLSLEELGDLVRP